MPSPTAIPGRIRNTASDHHMEGLATSALDHRGIHLHFTVEAYGSKAETLKQAKRLQSAFGVYRARARRRGFRLEQQMGHDPNPLTYEHAYDEIEIQVHETEDGHEVRLVLFQDLYKGMIITDTRGKPIERESQAQPSKAPMVAKSFSVDDVFASLKNKTALSE